ncbi:MAG: hypothetical protein AAF348_19830 [Bacteroidota bacterium]
MTKKFIIEVQVLKENIKDKDITLREAVILLSQLFDKYDFPGGHEDGEKVLFRDLIKLGSLKKIRRKGQLDRQTIKNLKIVLLLMDFGFRDVNQKDVELILKGT